MQFEDPLLPWLADQQQGVWTIDWHHHCHQPSPSKYIYAIYRATKEIQYIKKQSKQKKDTMLFCQSIVKLEMPERKKSGYAGRKDIKVRPNFQTNHNTKGNITFTTSRGKCVTVTQWGQGKCCGKGLAVCMPAVDVLRCTQRYRYNVHKHSIVYRRDETEMVSLARRPGICRKLEVGRAERRLFSSAVSSFPILASFLWCHH